MAETIETQRTSAPSAPTSGRWKRYFKAGGMYFMSSSGVEIGPFDDGSCWQYTIQAVVSSNNLTVSLKRLDGSDATADTPIKIRVGGEILAITSALSLTLTSANGDLFGWLGRMIQDNDAQLFMYLVNNNGTPQLGLCQFATMTTVAGVYFDAGGQTGSLTQRNFIMSGTRNATNTCAVIGRIQVKQASSTNFWVTPTTASVWNFPIYRTDILSYSPVQTGWATQPGIIAQYYVNYDFVHVEWNQTTSVNSSANTMLFTLPFTAAVLSAKQWQAYPGQAIDNGSPLAAPCFGFIASAAMSIDFRKDYAGNVWTVGAVVKKLAGSAADYLAK